jgi:polar amino acid transport system substrate-binding protein
MNKPRSLFLLVVGVVAATALAIAIAACGSSSSSTSSPAASAAAGASGTPTVKADATLNAMLPAAIKSAGTLRVATNIPYPPWEMYTAVGSKQATGIDYDLSQAIGARLGVKTSFDQTVFDSIIPALLAGKEDMVMASMFDNKVRQAQLNFVDYANDGYGIILPKANPGNIHTIDDLAGKTIAVQSGTSQVGELKKLQAKFKSEGKPPLTILQYPQDSDALLAMTSGKAVAQMDDQSVAAYTVKTFDNGNTFMLLSDPSVAASFQNAIIGVGVPKNDTQLRDAVQKSLQSLIDDGTYAKILAKYGESSLAVTSALINQGK